MTPRSHVWFAYATIHRQRGELYQYELCLRRHTRQLIRECQHRQNVEIVTVPLRAWRKDGVTCKR